MVAFILSNKLFKPLGSPKWMTEVSCGFAEDIATKSQEGKKK